MAFQKGHPKPKNAYKFPKGKNHPRFKGGRDLENVRRIKKKYKKSEKGKISQQKYMKSDKKKAVALKYAHKSRAGKSYSLAELRDLIKKYGGKCANCGDTGKDVDHFYPLSKGGTNEIENLQILCHSCNAKKGNKVISMEGECRDPMLKPMYRYRAKCIRVIDGDSIVCDLDCGFYITLKDVVFRLNRINAPEIKGKERPEGLKAKKALKEIVEGKEIIIETYKGKERGKYGRYLCEIWKEGLNINDWLVQQGFAEYKEY